MSVRLRPTAPLVRVRQPENLLPARDWRVAQQRVPPTEGPRPRWGKPSPRHKTCPEAETNNWCYTWGMAEQKLQNPTVFIPHHPWRRRLVIGILTICLVGAAASFFIARWADRGQRDGLYEVANLIRYSVDPQLVTQLTGQPADAAAPAYAQLQKTFVDLGNATQKIRYIYLMGRRDQQNVFFYLDSQPDRYASAGQPPLAVPGEVYEDVTDGVLDVFFNGVSTVVGPETDKWGTFVSALVPVRDDQEHVVALLGVDVEASSFQANVRARVLIAIITTLLLAAVYAVFIIMRIRSHHHVDPTQRAE